MDFEKRVENLEVENKMEREQPSAEVYAFEIYPFGSARVSETRYELQTEKNKIGFSIGGANNPRALGKYIAEAGHARTGVRNSTRDITYFMDHHTDEGANTFCNTIRERVLKSISERN